MLRRDILLLKYITNVLESWSDGWRHQLVKKFGNVFVEWRKPSRMLYSKTELQRLHLHFCHPFVGNLYNPLKRGQPENANNYFYKILEDISRACK